MINDSFSQFLKFFNNGFWFYSMMGGWSTLQWVFLYSSQFFWSFDTPETPQTPGSVSAVFAENEIWNRLKQFRPVHCSVRLYNLNSSLENHWPYCAKATHIITDNKAQNEQMHFLVAKLIVLIISSCTAGYFSKNS